MFDPAKPAATLPEMAQRSFSQHADRPCLGVKSKESGEYVYASYGDIGARVQSLTGALLHSGLERGDRAAILSENRPEWAMADLACQMRGVISVPMFPTLPAVQVKGILQDCGARLVFVSSPSQLKKIEEIRAELPDLEAVVVMDDIEGQTTFASLEREGAAHLEANPGLYEMTWPAAGADDVATIIYTSGTTGTPKGVMLTQRNLLSNMEAIREALQEAFRDLNNELFLSFLPLAHIYERTAGYYLPLRLGAGIAYCESLFTVDKNLREARPTIMFCVPRLYESMREKLYSAANALPENQREAYLDALQLAQKAGMNKGQVEGAPSLSLGEKLKYRVYDAKVYSKIRDKFGGRLKAFVSGGAPMAPELGALFLGVGLNILEGYGLTETSPVIAVNRPGRVKLGTVGEPLSSVEVQLASDGEIRVRGASIMKGYWNKPDETREALDADGWFATGDIGQMDGPYLKITDRKKDLLVLANGKKVAPQPIELRLGQSRFIAQVVLLGDKQKSVSALIVPNLDALREWAAKQNLGVEGDEQLLVAPGVQKLFKDEIESLTNDLAD